MSVLAVGYRKGTIEDDSRRNWAGDGPRPLPWSAWYPCDRPGPQRIAENAPLSPEQKQFPVVLLSHGTGGTAFGLGWLAQNLAAAGHIVLGVDHHGNTARERYRPEGFLCWWERPRDLTVALDILSQQQPFAGRLDLDRVSAAGFSLGGHTVLSLAGAITDCDLFAAWREGGQPSRGPREFPDLGSHVERLLQESPVFRRSWESQSASRRDERVKAVFALAPAPPVRAFTPDSLRTLALPIALVVGDADTEAPAEACAAWLHQHLPGSTYDILGPDIGHYAMLCEGAEEPEIWTDPEGIDWRGLRARIAGIARQALSMPLPVNR